MGRHWHTPVVDSNLDLVVGTYSAVAGFVVAVLAVEQVVRHWDFALLIVVPNVDTTQPYTVSIH